MQKNVKIYTVSQINSLIKVVLEENLPARLIVKGEIRDWKKHASGHCYFCLKDEGGILPSVIWASKFKSVKFTPEDGMAVLATGCIDVYTTGGKYQFYADKLEPAGKGTLQLAFEQLVNKLRAEGLFDEVHKKALPEYPQRIGILTSESGAAIHDIQDSIYSRWPCVRLFLYPVPVQGEGAAEKIAAALRDLNKHNKQHKLDLIIVGRGGGSLEDLWAFNEEVLARAIYDSKIPMVSAVGHEVDTTIADLVADARASTPTKAGVVAVPDMQEVLGFLTNIEKRIAGRTRAILQLARSNLEVVLAYAAFRNPLLLVHNSEQQLDDLDSQLEQSIQELLAELHGKLANAYEQIAQIEPHRLLGRRTIELNNLHNRTNIGINSIINSLRIQFTASANRLEGLNPKSVLCRGYSITTNKKRGVLIKTINDVNIGDDLVTELANENFIESTVTKK